MRDIGARRVNVHFNSHFEMQKGSERLNFVCTSKIISANPEPVTSIDMDFEPTKSWPHNPRSGDGQHSLSTERYREKLIQETELARRSLAEISPLSMQRTPERTQYQPPRVVSHFIDEATLQEITERVQNVKSIFS